MSIATAITDLSARIQGAYAACESKGATIPATKNTTNLPATIASIPSGGGLQGYTLTVRGSTDASTPDFHAFVYSDGTAIAYNTNAKLYNGGTFTLNNVVSYVGMNNGNTSTQLTGNTSITLKMACLLKGTLITLADGTKKKIEDITYDDNISVWDFDNCTFVSAKPLWIKKAQTAGYYFTCTFEDGTVLKITGKSETGWGHRGLNLTRGSFTYFPASVGDMFSTENGAKRLNSCVREEGVVEYYNVITDKHFNLFANGILTSCSLNNYRKIGRCELRFIEKPKTYHKREEFVGIPDSYVEGLRLCEQPIGVDELNVYVRRLLTNAK